MNQKPLIYIDIFSCSLIGDQKNDNYIGTYTLNTIKNERLKILDINIEKNKKNIWSKLHGEN